MNSVLLLRLSLGVVFLWFGLLKFFPGASSAEPLAVRTIFELSFGLVGPNFSLPILAAWECLIGIGLIYGRYLRVTLALMLVQMTGTFMPLLLFPDEMFRRPFVTTFEGQYIIKNIVFVAAALVIDGRRPPPIGAASGAAPAPRGAVALPSRFKGLKRSGGAEF